MSKYETEKKWRKAHPEKIREYRKKSALNQRDLHQKWLTENRERWNAYKRTWQAKRRFEILFHYSKGKMCCACCKENHLEFLCIDHIKGDGAKHRKELGKGSTNLYAYLKQNNFPKGFRVLCHNCNMSLGFYGHCPHNKNSKNVKGE